MALSSELTNNRLRIEGDARQQLYDASGYGKPSDSGSDIYCSFVEGIYLYRKGKIELPEGYTKEEIIDEAIDVNKGFNETLYIYTDLRDRGYYLSHKNGNRDLFLYSRGEHPSGNNYERKVHPVREIAEMTLDELKEMDMAGIIDEDGDVTYFTFNEWSESGEIGEVKGGYTAKKTGDKIYLLNAGSLNDKYLIGSAQQEKLVLSPEEVVYLIDKGVIESGSHNVSVDKDRYSIYSDLRNRGIAVRTGFKFGADYRLYTEVKEENQKRHSDYLVKIIDSDKINYRGVAGIVRLSESVKKQSILAIPDSSPEYICVERVTP